MSADIKLPKAQMSKIIQSGGFLGSLLSKIAGPLVKVAVPFAEKILALLRIAPAASTIDAGNQKKIHAPGRATLIISNEEMNGINILLKGITKTIKNKTKQQKGAFYLCY